VPARPIAARRITGVLAAIFSIRLGNAAARRVGRTPARNKISAA